MKSCLTFIFLLLSSNQCFSNNFDWGWKKPKLTYNGVWEKKVKKNKKNTFYKNSILNYKKNVSPLQGNRCPAFPTCSTFTLYSMQEYGFFIGFFMGMDRIFFKENRGMLNNTHYHMIERGMFNKKNLKGKIYDIPEANNIFIEKDWRFINPDFYFMFIEDRCSDYCYL